MNLDDEMEYERLAQSVLRMLSVLPYSTGSVAAMLGVDPVEANVLLRRMAGRVINVTTHEDRAQNRTVWIAAEVPLTI